MCSNLRDVHHCRSLSVVTIVGTYALPSEFDAAHKQDPTVSHYLQHDRSVNDLVYFFTRV